jgi:DNA polymerase I-like protein with 3'-5' exonuclease and polymerase domains
LRRKIFKHKVGEEFEVPVIGHGGRFGYEMRGCLTVEDPRKRCIVGSDAAGIQLRALTHYMGDEEYKDVILNGDVHRYNAAKLFGLNSPDDVTPDQRKTAKVFIYAFLLGAGDWKIGDIAGVPEGGFLEISQKDYKWFVKNTRTGEEEFLTEQTLTKRGLIKYVQRVNWKTGEVQGFKRNAKVSEKIAAGARLRQQFLDGLPKLAELIKEAHERADIGYMKGLDGRAVPIPSKHKSLTAYLQSYEAIIMKTAIVLWHKKKDEMGIDAHAVAFVHDELQMDCAIEDADKAGQLFVNCIGEAGRLYSSFIPLDGSYLVGSSWADAH